ncbi:hypothetical protein [Gilvimarinus algae]|uniref:Uncharacterized protein n=1 Tax=Gilvimarinus algae TaxID=3058037 RepID=A0ABT8TF23_9GAMM|nr:hypothetical protein [Gilvimarinus sp. SDUM040014]MDO3382687.1 hypothetical protein [Gilvimarinus sp. SDUM040014]
MDREREKTKSELLNELESIQGLLDDDIPLLNQVIDKLDHSNPQQSAASALREHFSEEDLQSLQSAYDALAGGSSTTAGDTTPASEPPLRHEEENYELDLGSLPTHTPEPPAPPLEALTPKPQANSPLPGQRPLFQAPAPGGEPANQTNTGSQQREPDAGSTTNTAENPFLPQHIRDRLRGNRAGEFAAQSIPAYYSRQQLVDELIDTVMGQLETNLRLKLAVMSEQELRALLKDKP